uniref:Uncharacterized protein n=1 Tax=Anguilla anguilla TaxID=7936 RepID=A0A0E9UC76_ANGAN
MSVKYACHFPLSGSGAPWKGCTDNGSATNS